MKVSELLAEISRLKEVHPNIDEFEIAFYGNSSDVENVFTDPSDETLILSSD